VQARLCHTAALFQIALSLYNKQDPSSTHQNDTASNQDRHESKRNSIVLLSQARKASDLLKALSHETRLMILCILSEGEKSVSELEEILSMPQAAVSQQLAGCALTVWSTPAVKAG
jgi:hypothetical protein